MSIVDTEVYEIRLIREEDREKVANMMRRFYDSPAVILDVPDDVIRRDLDACLSGSPYLEGYVFAAGNVLAGYGMLAKSFSTESGGLCVWIEDIYLEEPYRHLGLGTRFLNHVSEKYRHSAVRLRLEVERENVPAYAAYRKNGFRELGYVQMVKERE